MRVPTQEGPLNGGIQRIYKLSNGRGASVVQHSFSYGNKEGLWELAVLDSNGDLDFTTPITNDVIGFLSDSDVDSALAEIEALDPEPAD